MTIPIELVFGVIVMLILAPVVAAVVYRLVIVRRDSTSILVRRSGDRSWSYGAIRYSDTELAFYRLVSVRFGADTHLDRRTLILGPQRQPTGADLDVAEAGESIVSYSGHDRRDRAVEGELCLGPSQVTALRAWIEACSVEQIRSRRPGRRRR